MVARPLNNDSRALSRLVLISAQSLRIVLKELGGATIDFDGTVPTEIIVLLNICIPTKEFQNKIKVTLKQALRTF